MKSKYLPYFLALLLLAAFYFQGSRNTYAQQDNSSDNVPSDLSLDLKLAQQNPAPEQNKILSSETKQAIITTSSGDKATVKLQDDVAPKANSQSKSDTVNPDQTTSEQVITKPSTVQVIDNGSPSPTTDSQGNPATGDSPSPSINDNTAPANGSPSGPSINNNGGANQISGVLPGTNTIEPNDNAAPSDNSSNTNLPAPVQPADQSQSNSPAGDSGNSQPSSNDNSTVQGAKTGSGSMLLNFVRSIKKFLTGK